VNVNRASLLVLIAVFAVVSSAQRHSPKYETSLAASCSSGIFLNTAISTPNRDALPQVQIKVSDPLGRVQGENAQGPRIPNSRYKEVVEIPALPNRSRVHAVEICAAKTGQYELTVYEHGADLYRITVNADVSVSMTASLHAREGRVRHYKFLVESGKDKPNVTWLDKNGKPRLNLDDIDW
jgi:hypothetical protein